MKQRVKGKTGRFGLSRRDCFPLPRTGYKVIDDVRPVVKSSGFKVASVWPDQRMNLRINSNLVEEFQIAQRPEQFTCQYRLKINDLFRFVIKSDPESVGRKNSERLNAIDAVLHKKLLYLSG